jgi:hypothetical protein
LFLLPGNSRKPFRNTIRIVEWQHFRANTGVVQVSAIEGNGIDVASVVVLVDLDAFRRNGDTFLHVESVYVELSKMFPIVSIRHCRFCRRMVDYYCIGSFGF